MAFFVAVLTCQQYIFFDMEQARVLVYEWERIAEQMMRAGGVADFIALFLQQFFLFKVAAAAIMALLLTSISLCLHKVYIYAAGRSTSLAEKILCCLPAALLFVYTEGKIFFITGHVAILLSSIGLLLATLLIKGNNTSPIQRILRYIGIPLLIIFVGFAAQTAVWPMIASIFLYSLLYKKDYISAGITVISAVLMVGLGRYTCLAITKDELFSPDIFSYRTQIPTTMVWVWLAIIVLSFLPLIVKKFLSEKVVKHIASAIVAAIAVIALTHTAYKAHYDEDSDQRLALQHWIDTKDYEPAMQYCMEHLTNTYISNMYFMMLSETNNLENEVGGILKDGRQLIMTPNNFRHVRRHLMSLYYYLGYVNGAQREAFEYNEPSDGMMVPGCLKILALTNIIQGNYALAEKYLNHLDHTLFYSEWAKQQRHFLYNDKAVENDPELGPRRKTTAIESIPQIWTTHPEIIRQIASVAPELPATNYKKAYLLLGEYEKKNTNENQQQSYIQY